VSKTSLGQRKTAAPARPPAPMTEAYACLQAPGELTQAGSAAIDELRRDLDSQGALLAHLTVELEVQAKQREAKAGGAVWSAAEIRTELASQRALCEQLEVELHSACQDWRLDSSRLRLALRALGEKRAPESQNPEVAEDTDPWAELMEQLGRNAGEAPTSKLQETSSELRERYGQREAKHMAIQVAALGAQLQNDIQTQFQDVMGNLRNTVSVKSAEMEESLRVQVAAIEVKLRNLVRPGGDRSSDTCASSAQVMQHELLVSATMLGQLGDVLSLGQNVLVESLQASSIQGTSQEPLEPVGELAAAWKGVRSQLECRLRELLASTREPSGHSGRPDALTEVCTAPLPSPTCVAYSVAAPCAPQFPAGPPRVPMAATQDRWPVRMTSAPAAGSRDQIPGETTGRGQISGRGSVDGGSTTLQVQRTLTAMACRGSSPIAAREQIMAEDPSPQNLLSPSVTRSPFLQPGPSRLQTMGAVTCPSIQEAGSATSSGCGNTSPAAQQHWPWPVLSKLGEHTSSRGTMSTTGPSTTAPSAAGPFRGAFGQLPPASPRWTGQRGMLTGCSQPIESAMNQAIVSGNVSRLAVSVPVSLSQCAQLSL